MSPGILRFGTKEKKNPSPLLREVSTDSVPTLDKEWSKENRNCRNSSTKRGHEICSLFLTSEKWAKTDWEEAMKTLSPAEISGLTPDHVVRVIRSSGFMAQPERRKRRNVYFFQEKIKMDKKYKVNELHKLCEGGPFTHKSLKHEITPARIEQFRSLAFPLKIFGRTKNQVPLVKFSLKECNWKVASKSFKDPIELRLLYLLTFENLMKELHKLKCHADCAEPDTFVIGKYILVADVEGLKIKDVKYGYLLQAYRVAATIWKYYPDTVLKTYVINNRYCTKGSQILYPFVPKRIINKLKFLPDDSELVKHLKDDDKFEVGQLPVEFGGHFEGRYVVDVSSD